MRLKCGDVCPRTGPYRVVDGQGRTLNVIYVGGGENMPPTQNPACRYEWDG